MPSSGVPAEVQGVNAPVGSAALFFPISDDPYYMPEGLMMGTDVMDLFGSVMPGAESSGAGNEVSEAWMQGLGNSQTQME